MNRRSVILQSAALLFAAPAVVRASSLMPIKPYKLTKPPFVYNGGDTIFIRNDCLVPPFPDMPLDTMVRMNVVDVSPLLYRTHSA